MGGGVWGRGRGVVACVALRQQWGALGGVVPQVGHQAAGRGRGAAFGRAQWWGGVRGWWLLLSAVALLLLLLLLLFLLLLWVPSSLLLLLLLLLVPLL